MCWNYEARLRCRTRWESLCFRCQRVVELELTSAQVRRISLSMATHLPNTTAPQIGDVSLKYPRRRCGGTYFASVTVKTCAGAERAVTSSGVGVCCNAPTQVPLKLIGSDGQPLPSVDSRSKEHLP